MKKRQMKKWIPKDTIYCLDCKWRKFLGTKKLHRNTGCESAHSCNAKCWTTPDTKCRYRIYRCEYMGYTDETEESLLWDGCKECGEHEPNI